MKPFERQPDVAAPAIDATRLRRIGAVPVKASGVSEAKARLHSILGSAGLSLNPIAAARTLARVPHFVSSWSKMRRQGGNARLLDLYPILTDAKKSAAVGGLEYFYQDLWAARKIAARRPDQHLDIGSRIDGFVAHLLAFGQPTVVVDIRPLKILVPGLTFIQEDATLLRRFSDRSQQSVSSLHAAEHFGLGRYGDPVDADGATKFMASLERILADDGWLYFSVPIGRRERIEFNAHRVYRPETVIRVFRNLRLASLSYTNHGGEWIENIEPQEIENLPDGCGLFEFTRHSSGVPDGS